MIFSLVSGSLFSFFSCIFVELFTRRAIFAGNDELHQIQVITDRLGPVTPDRWPEAETLPWFELVKAPGSEGAAKAEKQGEHQVQEQRQDSELLKISPESQQSAISSDLKVDKDAIPEQAAEPFVPLKEKEERIFSKALGK